MLLLLLLFGLCCFHIGISIALEFSVCEKGKTNERKIEKQRAMENGLRCALISSNQTFLFKSIMRFEKGNEEKLYVFLFNWKSVVSFGTNESVILSSFSVPFEPKEKIAFFLILFLSIFILFSYVLSPFFFLILNQQIFLSRFSFHCV